MNGNQLGTARKAVKVVRALSYFLFFLVIGLVAAAMWIAQVLFVIFLVLFLVALLFGRGRPPA